MSGLTTFFKSLFAGLMERRLWPIALVLVVAAIATPVVLSKPAKKSAPAPPAAPAAGTTPSALIATKPIVSTTGRPASSTRKILSRPGLIRKNPFRPSPVESAPSSASSSSVTPTAGSGATSTTGTSASSGSSTTTTTGTSGATGTTGTGGGSGGTTKKFYEYTTDVSFGKPDKEKKLTLRPYRALPSSDDPAVFFLGVRTDGKTAVFVLATGANTQGDGKCSPSDADCLFVYMKKDDKQSIETVSPSDGSVVTYELKLLDIDVRPTNGPNNASSSAKSSSAKAHRAGRRAERQAKRAAKRTQRKITRLFGLLGF